jgi:hypothetical protein
LLHGKTRNVNELWHEEEEKSGNSDTKVRKHESVHSLDQNLLEGGAKEVLSSSQSHRYTILEILAGVPELS